MVLVTILDRRFPNALQRLDVATVDYLVRVAPHKPTGDVVIAAIDDKSIDDIGVFAWPHSIEKKLVDALVEDGVAVIGFDLAFVDKPAEGSQASGDRQAIIANIDDDPLAKAIIKQHSAYLGYYFSSENGAEHALPCPTYKSALVEPAPLSYAVLKPAGIKPPRFLLRGRYCPPILALNTAAGGRTAFLDAYINEVDGNVRSFPTVLIFHDFNDHKDRYLAPMFIALSDAYLGRVPMAVELGSQGIERVTLGDRAVVVDEGGRMMLNLRGPPGTIPQYPVVDIINHKVDPSNLHGKIVIVGPTATAIADRFATPMGGNFPGVEIQANAVDNVVAGDFLYSSLFEVANAF
jgi:adenylate cyclase